MSLRTPPSRLHSDRIRTQKSKNHPHNKYNFQAYRKRALQEHPDKNIHRIEESTLLFAQIKQAYETLSDSNERAWYDAHRDSILGDSDLQSQSVGMTADTIAKYFHSACYRGFGDDDWGFYSVFRILFERIEEEEEMFLNEDEDVERTSFGSPVDGYEGFIKTSYETPYTLSGFYSKFMMFATKKSFAWCDVHKLSSRDERRIRRLMEKENKKAREIGKRLYNDSIRSLCAFIRKRDPRYNIHQLQVKRNQEEKQEAQMKKLAFEKLKREERGEEFVEQEWTKPRSNESLTPVNEYSESEIEGLI